MDKRILLAVLFSLGMASTVWADSIPQVVNSTTQSNWTRVVFNDAGSALTSGTVVIWDNDDTEFDRSGFPYVTTSTTADDIYTAGVIQDNSCPDQALCTIVTAGPTRTRISGLANGAAEDIFVGTSSTAGEADDYDEAASSCTLGIVLENRDVDTGVACTTSADNCPAMVLVNIQCSGPA